MSNAYKAAAAAVLAIRKGTPKSAATESQLKAARNLEDAMDSIADAERGLAEWREMALSQAGDAGVLRRMVKAETQLAMLVAALDGWDLLSATDALAAARVTLADLKRHNVGGEARA